MFSKYSPIAINSIKHVKNILDKQLSWTSEIKTGPVPGTCRNLSTHTRSQNSLQPKLASYGHQSVTCYCSSSGQENLQSKRVKVSVFNLTIISNRFRLINIIQAVIEH